MQIHTLAHRQAHKCTGKRAYQVGKEKNTLPKREGFVKVKVPNNFKIFF